MTISIRGHFDGKVIVPDEPVSLPRDQALTVDITVIPQSDAPEVQPFLDWVVNNTIDSEELPADLGKNLDHYLYGTPKREG